MVEGARLESVCTGNRTKGSNPFLSAIHSRSVPVTWVNELIQNGMLPGGQVIQETRWGPGT